MRVPVLSLALTLMSAPTLAPTLARADEVVVFAAASLSNALADIETGFEAATGHSVRVSLAGSSTLARQIQAGAPADIFLSANTDWMDVLDAEGLIEPGTRRDLLGNTLVLIGQTQAADVALRSDLPERIGAGYLAMALVDAVPAGIYGRAALQSLGLWDAVSGSVAQVDNVRAALRLVALGEAPLGIVYATDARAEPSVRIVATFPADSHPPIVYPVADLATRDTRAEAQFMAYLTGPEARAVFLAQGFSVLGE